MMLKEFETRTGYFPAMKEYEAIEKAYIEFGGDKDAFCNAYKENEDGIAEKIQYEVNMQYIHTQQLMDSYKAQIIELKKALEREEEWKLCENPNNVRQNDYERLAEGAETGNHSYYMTDAEAIARICDVFDFDPSKITIIHEVDELEVNRHKFLRKTGQKIERHPVYCAPDYYYIRFNTSYWYYEVWNGQLRPFYD